MTTKFESEHKVKVLELTVPATGFGFTIKVTGFVGIALQAPFFTFALNVCTPGIGEYGTKDKLGEVELPEAVLQVPPPSLEYSHPNTEPV